MSGFVTPPSPTRVARPAPLGGVWAHLRTWGLLWAAVLMSLLLIAATARMYLGISAHSDELAGVHGQHLASRFRPVGSLDEQLQGIHRDGAWSLTLYGPEGNPIRTVGRAPTHLPRAPAGPTPFLHGRYLIERASPEGVVVIEFVPMLADDLRRRASAGLRLSVFASMFLVVFVGLWIRHRLQLEALTLEAARHRHLAHLGTLSAVIAHELRNPLTILMGHAQLLREELPESRSLGHIESGAERLNLLLDSLLSYARTGELDRALTDPAAVLQDAVETSGIDVVVEGHAPDWSLDAIRMHQVFVNLLSNAYAASAGSPVHASVGVETDDLVIRVQDAGDGIPDGMHEAIFEPFHTTRARGTGLGLAVARNIVEAHGGTLTAHDAPEQGAVFVVRIPR